MRRCADRVEVLAPRASSAVGATAAESVAAPLVFRWRGRRYVVSAVLADWLEVEPWWGAAGTRGEGEAEQHWWRVEAGRRGVVAPHDLGSAAAVGLTHGVVTGVFDLCWRDGSWSMRRVAD